jgi:hypothetical protein
MESIEKPWRNRIREGAETLEGVKHIEARESGTLCGGEPWPAKSPKDHLVRAAACHSSSRRTAAVRVRDSESMTSAIIAFKTEHSRNLK